MDVRLKTRYQSKNEGGNWEKKFSFEEFPISYNVILLHFLGSFSHSFRWEERMLQGWLWGKRKCECNGCDLGKKIINGWISDGIQSIPGLSQILDLDLRNALLLQAVDEFLVSPGKCLNP